MAPLFLGQAEDYVPAAGLRWLISIDVARLAKNGDLLTMVSALVPKERMDHFGNVSGFKLEQVQRLVIAGFDYSTLYVVQVRGDNSRIEQRFIERLRHDPIVTHPRPALTTTTGMAGGAPQRMVRISNHLVAIAVGDPTPARAVEAYALGRLKKSPSAFKGAAFSTLPTELADADLLFFAPGPFKDEWAEGVRGLLQGALAVGATGKILKDANIRLSLWLSGGFAETPGASDQLLEGWNAVVQSPFGHLLGAHEPVEAPRISERSDALRLDVSLRLSAAVSGLHAAVSAEAWQFLGLGQNSALEHTGSQEALPD
ncbi:MAG: hypothetical protein SFV15_21330 [Polyangiaceae bacterium]|nr:hypothetical protein [Polyangiaceae bacterium]